MLSLLCNHCKMCECLFGHLATAQVYFIYLFFESPDSASYLSLGCSVPLGKCSVFDHELAPSLVC